MRQKYLETEGQTEMYRYTNRNAERHSQILRDRQTERSHRETEGQQTERQKDRKRDRKGKETEK